MGTSNLNLSVTTEVSGSETLFLVWRTQMDGDDPSSNMGIIDAWAGVVSGSITSLKSATVFSGSAIGDGTNYTSNISGIESLTDGLTVGMLFDTTNLGETTLDINGIGAKQIYKVQTNGNAVVPSAGDFSENRRYIFRYNGTYWVWVSATSGDQINVTGNLNNIIVTSASGITNGNISASSLALVTGSYVTLELNSNLTNEWLLSSGSSISIIQDTSSSKVYINVNTPGTAGDLVFLSSTGSLVDSGIQTAGAKISGSYIKSGSTLSIVSGSLNLAESGISSGSYNLFSVDEYGRATSGSLLMGSEFPESPFSSEPFFRQDIGIAAYYNDSRWISQRGRGSRSKEEVFIIPDDTDEEMYLAADLVASEFDTVEDCINYAISILPIEDHSGSPAGVINLSEGSFYVTGSIVVNSNIKIKGAGKRKTWIVPLVNVPSVIRTMGYPNYCDFLYLEDFTIWGGEALISDAAIDLRDTANSTIREVGIENVNGTGIWVRDPTEEPGTSFWVWIENCNISTNYGYYNVFFGSGDHYLIDSVLTSGSGILIDGGGIHIRDSHIAISTYGVTMESAGSSEVLGCMFDNISTNPIYVNFTGDIEGYSAGLNVSNNVFFNTLDAGSAVVSINGATDVMIRNNVFLNSQSASNIYIDDTSDYITVTGNRFDAPTNDFGSGNNNLIKDNNTSYDGNSYFHPQTAFPDNPVEGQDFYRGDLGWDCYYDGENWVTKHEYVVALSGDKLTNTGTIMNYALRQDYPIKIKHVDVYGIVETTNDGSNYWRPELWGYDETFTAYQYIHQTSSSLVSNDVTFINSGSPSESTVPITGGSAILNVWGQKTGSPGQLTSTVMVYYRIIVE